MTDSDNSVTCQMLMQQVGRGDATAFAELYDRTARAVFGLANSILADEATAAEATCEVYLQAWRTAARYNPNHGDVVTLLMTMIRRRALDGLRTMQAPEAMSTSPAPAWSCVGVDRLLTVVPARSRDVLLLTYFRGCTLAQVADLLNIPQATAASRLTEAFSSLRRGRPTDTGDDTHHPVDPSRSRQREDA